MLVLTRKTGQVVTIQLHETVDPQITLGELFANGPIQVMVTEINPIQVRLALRADRKFLILREECVRKPKVV